MRAEVRRRPRGGASVGSSDEAGVTDVPEKTVVDCVPAVTCDKLKAWLWLAGGAPPEAGWAGGTLDAGKAYDTVWLVSGWVTDKVWLVSGWEGGAPNMGDTCCAAEGGSR